VQLLFEPCFKLLKQVFGGISEGWDENCSETNWLVSYGLSRTHISYSGATDAIAATFTSSARTQTAILRESLKGDLERRLKNLRLVIQEGLFEPLPESLTEILIDSDFEMNFDFEDASKELREFHYRMAAKEDVDPEAYRDAKAEYERRVRVARKEFESRHSSVDLDLTEQRASSPPRYASASQLLRWYQKLDESMSRYESLVQQAASRWDREIQQYVDIQRGK
jgi:hypothetical protein